MTVKCGILGDEYNFIFSPSITVTSLVPRAVYIKCLSILHAIDREGHTICWLERTMVLNAKLELRI